MKIQKGELQLGRFLVPYRVYGESNKTIVCISGAKQTMAAWRSFVSHFVADYSVVLFDLPGQGRAVILEGSPAASFQEQQDVLLGVIQATNRDEKVVLAAASWGTIVSAAIAASHPKLVDKMILGSFGVKPNQEILSVIHQGKTLYDEDRLDQIAPLMIKSFGQQIPDSQKRQIVEQFGNMDREQFMSFYEHCVFVEQCDHIEEYIELSKIEAKTLIISGEHDAILDHQGIRDAAKRISDCVYKLVPGAGHFLHWEQPDILHTYRKFLST
ncbi:alpha/beta fold hydrolase [Glaciecola sp. SC05]|uniref:alpha/beta fold hydrolase n=1 Tax=Glaciecola sp. SC05 TaxID=1987355 RepID=UPI003528C109